MNSRQKFLHIALSAVFAFASALSPGAQAQQAGSEVGSSPALSDSELTFLLQQQEKRFETRFQAQEEALTQQRQLLERQQAAMATQAETIEALKARIDEIGSGTRARPTDTDEQQREIDAQREAIATQTAAIQALQTQFDQFTQDQQRTLSETDQQIRARLESLEGTMVGLQEQETTSTYDASEFPGAFQVPGTSAALKVGGFVKANVVQNFDGLTQQQNRFIVGFIPTRGEFTDDAEANLNVRQSRINLEYRQDTERGQLRAFIEGDFAGDGDTFRLRHAFGQFQDLLAGKYWSNFMDVDSSPEEVDFEGVNGRINTRQTQVRYFPEFGNGWNLILSAEDTQADVTGGEALSIYPDLVASIRRTLRDAWNVKFSVMFRSLEARWEEVQRQRPP
jgi:hypothetical protein